MADLGAHFHERMLAIYPAATACGYRPTYFLRMVYELGGVGAAKALLAKDHPAAGLATLWELGRLDLSMEAAAVEPQWASLFTEAEKATAARRLRALGHAI